MAANLVFVVTCYALSISLGLTGGHESPLIGLVYLSMFIPTGAVLVVSAALEEPPRVRWDNFSIKYLPVSLLLIPTVLHAVMLSLIVPLEGGVHWQDWLTQRADGLYHTPASRG